MWFRLSPRWARHLAPLALAAASLVASAAVGSILLSTARDAWAAIAAAGPAGPADGILLMAGLGGTLLSLWLGLGMAVAALAALPGALGRVCRRLAIRIAPAAMRKVVAFVLGTTLTAAFVPGTAVAGISRDTPRPAAFVAARHAVSGLADAAPDASFRFVSGPAPVMDAAPPPAWSPDRPASRRPIPASPVRSAPSADGTDSIVVHRGDTLWSIAAHHLGPAATAGEIDAEWHRWLAANRQVIGNDANLILPGQLLRPPPGGGSSGSASVQG